MTNYIQLNNLSFAYENQRPILQRLSLAVNKKDTLGIIGSNGAGKSTLLKLLVGLLPGFSGEAFIDSLPLKPENFHLIRQKLSLLMQNSDNQLFMPSVREEIAFMPRNYGWSEERIAERITEIAAMLPIARFLDQPLYKISGGEKKLAALAAIMALKPAMLLMDEPTGGLDPENRRRLVNLLSALPEGKIIASHDLDFIAETCGNVILLDKGRIIAAGDASSILCDEPLLTAHHLELPLSLQKNHLFKKEN